MMLLKTPKTYTPKAPGNARDEALCILLEITENQRKSHTILKERFDKLRETGQTPDHRDRALIERLVVGTLDRLITLDVIIGRFSRKPVRLLKPWIRGILRMSAYQILYMDRIPASAACNEAVELARLHGLEGLGGFVNGILRNIVRDRDEGGAKTSEFEEDWQKYSLPRWMAQLISGEYGEETGRRIFEAFLYDRRETVRLNLSRVPQAADPEEEICKSLAAEGVVFERIDMPALLEKAEASLPEGRLPVMYALENAGDITALESFRKGWITVQDPSSALVAAYAAPRENAHIIDTCAAPGGKTLALADMLDGSGSIDARDVSRQKVRLLEENIARCGFDNIKTSVMDAMTPDEDSFYRADIVIADLPCSGMGVIAKKPDIKLNLESYSIEELVLLQRDILANISRYVKHKGRLVYSTCTITQEENEQNAAWAAETLGFRLLSECRLLPDRDHDGFYIAVLEKTY